MRPLLLLPFLLLAASASAGDPAFAEIGKRSGEELLALCEPALLVLEAGGDAALDEKRRQSAASCLAFVDGFIWGHAWSAWRDRADMYYCPPENFSVREGVPAVVDYLRDEKERRVQRAHLLVFAAFNRAWPCPTSAPAR